MKLLENSQIKSLISVLGLLAVVANLWAASKLAPVAIELARYEERLKAVEIAVSLISPLNSRVDVLEEHQRSVDKMADDNVKSTDKRMERIENKLDSILTNLKN